MIQTIEKIMTQVDLRLWRGTMPIPLVQELRKAVYSMFTESHSDVSLTQKGFVDHSWNQIVSAAAGQGELWVSQKDGHLVGYLIAGYNNDVDNEPTYVIRQAWVHESLRRTPEVKIMLRRILGNAKSNFAQHVLIISSRHEKAYLRWLGRGWSHYVSILRSEL